MVDCIGGERNAIAGAMRTEADTKIVPLLVAKAVLDVVGALILILTAIEGAKGPFVAPFIIGVAYKPLLRPHGEVAADERGDKVHGSVQDFVMHVVVWA